MEASNCRDGRGVGELACDPASLTASELEVSLCLVGLGDRVVLTEAEGLTAACLVAATDGEGSEMVSAEAIEARERLALLLLPGDGMVSTDMASVVDKEDLLD